MVSNVLDGTDLILSVDGGALAFSTGCKITTSTETGERTTKEAQGGKWKQKFVKFLSESISADGLVCTDGSTSAPTYDQLKDIMLKGKPVDVSYSLRDGSDRAGKSSGGYSGKFIITSLDLDGQAADDAKYSIQLENYGAVAKNDDGLQEAASSTE